MSKGIPESVTSHREILRSSSIIGGAAAFNIAAGLIKTKIVALLLGPIGVGVAVLLQNLMQTVGAVAGLSLGAVGTRQLAEAVGTGNQQQIAIVRRALWWAAAVLAIAGSLVFAIASPWIGRLFQADIPVGAPIAWLAIGVGLSVVGQGQSALLTGSRRIGDLARVSILSVNLAAVAGILAIAIWGQSGIMVFVLAPVVATAFAGQFYVRRLSAPAPVVGATNAIKAQWAAMWRLGVAMTLAATAVTGGQLAARTLIQRDLGAEAVGNFQASWLVSVTYIGFVLQAMGTDFYPRITAAIGNRAAANALVNEQTEVALLLAAPVLLGALGMAPWIVPLLYSHAFAPAVTVLQWQVLGDVLKVASWPLGYLLLASGASRAYMIAEISAIIVFLAVLTLALPLVGLEGSGQAVVAMYLVYLPFVFLTARIRTGFQWSHSNLGLLGTLAGSAVVTLAVSRLSPVGGGALGVALALCATGLCLWRLRNALPGPVATIVTWFRRALL